MKLFVLCLAVLTAAAGVAFGQAGYIGVYSDDKAGSCEFTPKGFVQIHVFHMGTEGAAAAQFRLETPDNWTHLGDKWNFQAVIGKSNEGVSVAYGDCQESPVYLGVCTFQTSGDEPCTLIRVVPDPNSPSGKIEAVDCRKPVNKIFPEGSCGYVNPTDACRCKPGEATCPDSKKDEEKKEKSGG